MLFPVLGALALSSPRPRHIFFILQTVKHHSGWCPHPSLSQVPLFCALMEQCSFPSTAATSASNDTYSTVLGVCVLSCKSPSSVEVGSIFIFFNLSLPVVSSTVPGKQQVFNKHLLDETIGPVSVYLST